MYNTMAQKILVAVGRFLTTMSTLHVNNCKGQLYMFFIINTIHSLVGIKCCFCKLPFTSKLIILRQRQVRRINQTNELMYAINRYTLSFRIPDCMNTFTQRLKAQLFNNPFSFHDALQNTDHTQYCY